MKHLIEFNNTAFYTVAAKLSVMAVAASATFASAAVMSNGANDSGIHTVDKGEILWCIAHHTYGDPRAYRDIHRANPELIDPDKIAVGDRLVLPDTVRQFEGQLPQSATSCCSGTYFKNTLECRHRGKPLEYAKPTYSITTDASGAIKAIQQHNQNERESVDIVERPHRPADEPRRWGDDEPAALASVLRTVKQSYQFVIDGNDNPAIIQIPNDQPY